MATHSHLLRIVVDERLMNNVDHLISLLLLLLLVEATRLLLLQHALSRRVPLRGSAIVDPRAVLSARLVFGRRRHIQVVTHVVCTGGRKPVHGLTSEWRRLELVVLRVYGLNLAESNTMLVLLLRLVHEH